MRIKADKEKVKVEDWKVLSGEYNVREIEVELSAELLASEGCVLNIRLCDDTVFESEIVNGKADFPCFTTPQLVSIGVYAYDTGEDGELIKRYSPEPCSGWVKLGSYLEQGSTPPLPSPGTYAELEKLLKKQSFQIITNDVNIWDLESGAYRVSGRIFYKKQSSSLFNTTFSNVYLFVIKFNDLIAWFALGMESSTPFLLKGKTTNEGAYGEYQVYLTQKDIENCIIKELDCEKEYDPDSVYSANVINKALLRIEQVYLEKANVVQELDIEKEFNENNVYSANVLNAALKEVAAELEKIINGSSIGGSTNIEQEYNPESENAQSGIAVAQAVSCGWKEPTINLYDPAVQTEDTISPYYFASGASSSNTSLAASYNCTNFIEVEPNTEYTIGLVPAVVHNTYGEIVKPWHNAAQGLFFYDETQTYISGITESTFITPENAKYIRFNYFKATAYTVPLDVLNAKCMLVEGATLPLNYVAYGFIDLKPKLIELLSVPVSIPKIHYSISGDEIAVISKYGNDTDLVTILNKHGGNNLFDFARLETIPNTSLFPFDNRNEAESILGFGTDIHAPFCVQAVNNADGDGTATNYTGGNHAYGGVATARTSVLRFFIDGKEMTDGEGYCSQVEIRWTNLVQAVNTFKADGTGREVLQENHRLVFDGVVWKTEVEIIPLEDVVMKVWYGLQMYGTNSIYPNVIYVGGENRAVNNAVDGTNCGNNTASKFIAYGDTHRCEVEIDSTYDLGDRSMYSGTQGIFSSSAGKVYFYIILNNNLSANCLYGLRGKYRFLPV